MAQLALPRMDSLGAIPGLRQLMLLVGIAGAVAAGVSIYMWSQKPPMAAVYSSLSTKDSSDVAEALRASNIPFEVDSNSGTVMVAGDKVYEARLKLASQGLPKTSSMGFEMMQQDQGFGTSQFVESARYQHALETELGRTISSLQWVQGARVHLALPKQSVFANGGSEASASVLVDLAAGRSLDGTQISSIVHLVASSVPSLSIANVTVIDQYGNLLSSSGDSNDPARLMANQFEQAHKLEADYVRRIEQLLMPMTGSGRVSAQVVANMDFSEVEEATESYKPDSAIVRSEQTSENSTRSPAAVAQGVPGATSNQPPSNAQAQPLNPPAALNAAGKAANAKAAPVAAAGDSTSSTPITESRNSTRNYEMDRTVSHTRHPGGVVRRLSVAVLVDNLPKPDGKGGTVLTPLSKDELAKVENLVKQAVGFDETRGDTMSVQNALFTTNPVPVEKATPVWERKDVREYGRQGIGLLVVVLLVFTVVRPALRYLMETDPNKAIKAVLVNQSEPATEMVDAHHAAQPEERPRAAPLYDQKLALARGAVAADPKRVAQVIKTWVNTDG
ncbi:MAG: flagellar basal body M-ring protein FliF [Rhizobium sp.]|nr:MAG: flagellar basal body M-ring protein FliF [Rhizobium sp.]